MTDDYPNDSDGDALREVAAHGSDVTQPMDIDFPVVVATEDTAKQFAPIAAERGYRTHLWKHDDDPDWDVVCTIRMVPAYSDVVRVQHELIQLARPFHGACESWGTFGNKPQPKPHSE